MTPRQRKAVGIGVSGALGVAAGIIMYVTTSTPEWVGLAVQIAGLVAGALGFTIALPNTED